MLNDPLSNAMSKIMNAERVGKEICIIKPSSKTIKKILDIMKDNNYLGSYKEVISSRGNYLDLHLIGHINKCNAIKPRFQVKKQDFERFEKNFLPAKDFGILIVSTSKGMMTHLEAKKRGIAGRLVAYCY